MVLFLKKDCLLPSQYSKPVESSCGTVVQAVSAIPAASMRVPPKRRDRRSVGCDCSSAATIPTKKKTKPICFSPMEARGAHRPNVAIAPQEQEDQAGGECRQAGGGGERDAETDCASLPPRHSPRNGRADDEADVLGGAEQRHTAGPVTRRCHVRGVALDERTAAGRGPADEADEEGQVDVRLGSEAGRQDLVACVSQPHR